MSAHQHQVSAQDLESSASRRTAASLVRYEMIAEAEARVRTAEAAWNAAASAVDAAEQDLEYSRSAPERLFRHATSGAPVADEDIDALVGLEERLRHRVTFRRRVADEFRARLESAKADAARARSAAYIPVLNVAAEARVAAVERAMLAVASATSKGRPGELAAAQAAWDASNDLLRLVRANCDLLRGFEIAPRVASNAAQERATWQSILRRSEGFASAA
jgi:hypothetical protein